MDNKNRKINKTVTQAITDKYTKFKTEEKEAILKSFRCEKDEEYWAENIRQFILVEVKTSEEYTQEEIDYVQKSLKEAKEAGHSNTANSEGWEEGHGYSVSETNVINCLKSLKGVKHGDDMNDEQLRRRQARNVRQKYEYTYSY